MPKKDKDSLPLKPFFNIVRFMGCLISSEPSLTPQQMLEKQRKIMLDRQKEFEKKRDLQNLKPTQQQQMPNRDQQRSSKEISRSLEAFSKIPIRNVESSDGIRQSGTVEVLPSSVQNAKPETHQRLP